MQNEDKKPPAKKRIMHILIGGGVGTLMLVGGLYWYFKGRRGVKINNTQSDLFHKLNESNQSLINQDAQLPVSSGFPLRVGSQGSLVKQLQQALLAKYGDSLLPKYGADGSFGTETVTALKSKGLPTVINQTTFNQLVSDSPALPVNTQDSKAELHPSIQQPIDIAKNLWLQANNKNLEGILTELQKINTVKDYVVTNALFKTLYLRGVRQTIVNACLSSFPDEASKQQIRNELLRIGLKNNNNKWSLSGLQDEIITNRVTSIHSLDGLSLAVPANTLLGTFLGSNDDVTAFSSMDNETLYVPTNHISHV